MRGPALILALVAGCAPPPPTAQRAPLAPQAQPGPLAPQAPCRITRVIDGDTIKVACGSAQGNVRLMGFDTPETYGARCAAERRLGQRATRHLRALIAQAREITPQMHGTDKYRRLLARLLLDGRDVADIMISAGLAVPNHGERRINWCERLNAI